MPDFDVVIIGAGIAGASVAAEISAHCKVLLLERENQPGYHATGRSNALFHETYGGPYVQPLTAASKSLLASGGFLSPRPTITIGRKEDASRIARFVDEFDRAGVKIVGLDAAGVFGLLPGVRPDWSEAALEADNADIDVAALHQSFLRRAREQNATIICDAEVARLNWGNDGWTITGRAGEFSARIVVNAAGAWADELAQSAGVRPLGLTPYRRTIIQLGLGRPIPSDAPMVIDINGGFYFKPDGPRRVWLSPHDETPSSPCDAAPEEIDIAMAIDRFEGVVDWSIARVEAKWAGLRTFAPDRLPVYGFASDCPSFFWCAGQGGFGIQTAPAAGQLCASMILGDANLAPVDGSRYAPARFD